MSIEQEKKISSQITKKMRKITADIDDTVNVIATTDQTSALFWSKIKRELKSSYKEAEKAFKDWSASELTGWYNKSVRNSLKKINNLKLFKGNRFSLKEILNKRSSAKSKSALVEETNTGYVKGLNGGEKNLIRLADLTQQQNIGQKKIDDQIKDGTLPSDTIYTGNKKRRDALLKEALDGKYITITDKNGKKRNFKLKSYTDMVARTKLRESATLATVDTTISVGGDLVQVSSHNTQTPLDAQFEGKIYSLSGKDPDFPKATLLPPFHPYCIHSISTVFRETLEERGIDKYIDFAQGKTDVHPTRKAHKPVKERKL